MISMIIKLRLKMFQTNSRNRRHHREVSRCHGCGQGCWGIRLRGSCRCRRCCSGGGRRCTSSCRCGRWGCSGCCGRLASRGGRCRGGGCACRRWRSGRQQAQLPHRQELPRPDAHDLPDHQDAPNAQPPDRRSSSKRQRPRQTGCDEKSLCDAWRCPHGSFGSRIEHAERSAIHDENPCESAFN